MASTSASSMPASASTCAIRPGRISTCARAAISGTTPPNGRCAVVLADHGLGEDLPVAGRPARPPSRRRWIRCRGSTPSAAPLPQAAALALVGRPVCAADPHDAPFGTRGSPLALAQAHKVASALRGANGWPAELRRRSSRSRRRGDRIQDRPLAEIGGKALWTKELDRALLEGRIDFCVHSMKDVESDPPARDHHRRDAAARRRARPADRRRAHRRTCPRAPMVGTSSPRREAQLLSLRPDLEIVPLRGNVQTRLAKLEAGEVDATLLAGAGLRRLGMGNVGTPPLRVSASGADAGRDRDRVPLQRHADPVCPDGRRRPDDPRPDPCRARLHRRSGRKLPLAGRRLRGDRGRQGQVAGAAALRGRPRPSCDEHCSNAGIMKRRSASRLPCSKRRPSPSVPCSARDEATVRLPAGAGCTADDPDGRGARPRGGVDPALRA